MANVTRIYGAFHPQGRITPEGDFIPHCPPAKLTLRMYWSNIKLAGRMFRMSLLGGECHFIIRSPVDYDSSKLPMMEFRLFERRLTAWIKQEGRQRELF